MHLKQQSKQQSLTAPIKITFTSLSLACSAPNLSVLSKREKRRACPAPFCDNVTVTENALLYGTEKCSLSEITTLKIVQLRYRKSVIEKRATNLLSTLAITVGIVLFFGAASIGLKLLSLGLCFLSLAYLGLFYWQLLHQKVGEYGLLLRLEKPSLEKLRIKKLRIKKLKIKKSRSPIITSHNIEAIQTLYSAIVERTQRGERSKAMYPNRFISINMYTGSTYSE